jgi:hypothetical protein
MKLDSSLSSFRVALLAAGQPGGAPKEGLVALPAARDAGGLGLEAEGSLPSYRGELRGSSLADVDTVRRTIFEGCVGKTLAALEAAVAIERAGDQATMTALEFVREDETRRAELAWRSVSRALEVGGDAVREAAAEAFASALEGATGDAFGAPSGYGAGDVDDDLGTALDFLSERERSELRQRVLCDVIGPCAEQLLAAAFDQGAGHLRPGGPGRGAGDQRTRRIATGSEAGPSPARRE